MASRLIKGITTRIPHRNRQSSMRAQRTSLKVRASMAEKVIDNERKHMIRSAFTLFPESSVKTAWDCVGFIFIVC